MRARTEAKTCSETAWPYAPLALQRAAPAGTVPGATYLS